MVVAAQDRRISQAHPNLVHPDGAGCDGRSAPRFSDPEGSGPEASHGGEDRGLYGPGRTGAGNRATPASRWPPPPLTDAATALVEAVRTGFANFAGFVPEEISSRRWASVTFQGARHEFAFRLEGDGADGAAARFLGGLDARGFTLRGHLLADISLMAEERRPGFARIRLQALTVEER
jgi:hypothetical protein